jgi:hypothetical protein
LYGAFEPFLFDIIVFSRKIHYNSKVWALQLFYASFQNFMRLLLVLPPNPERVRTKVSMAMGLIIVTNQNNM